MKSSGNSLIEYALPLAIFMMTGILIAVVGNLPERLANYVSETLNGSVEGQNVRVEALGTIPQATMSHYRDSMSQGGGAGASGFTALSDGVNIETAGSNGTEQALALIDETISKLLQAGELTPEEENLLAQLSNKGHEIAALQRLIESEAASFRAENGVGFGQNPVTFNGQTQDLQTWADDMSYGSTHQAFLSLYQKVRQSDAMARNPDARAVVEQAATQIETIKRDFEHMVDQAALHDAEVIKISNQEASRQTDRESETVCKTGGRQDSGTHCN